MGISVGVVYDSKLDGFVTYFEDQISQMIDHLFGCQLVVGFNSRRFDYRVLSAYTKIPMNAEDIVFFTLPTLDILEEIKNRLGYRLSLNRLAEETLGSKKSSDGMQALKWYKEGKLKEIAAYCKEDVKLTRNLFLFAVENGHVLFRNKAGKSVRLPLNLEQRIYQIVAAGS